VSRMNPPYRRATSVSTLANAPLEAEASGDEQDRTTERALVGQLP
jgi:hypothetical protein